MASGESDDDTEQPEELTRYRLRDVRKSVNVDNDGDSIDY